MYLRPDSNTLISFILLTREGWAVRLLGYVIFLVWFFDLNTSCLFKYLLTLTFHYLHSQLN